jgi:hypothetical protein
MCMNGAHSHMKYANVHTLGIYLTYMQQNLNLTWAKSISSIFLIIHSQKRIFTISIVSKQYTPGPFGPV